MQYKTIVLEMIQSRPHLHDFLKASKTLLLTLDSLANELKSSHEHWMERFSLACPESDANQITSETLEIAVKELESHLPTVSVEEEEFNLDEAMIFIRRHTPPA